jgi:hypothetical protein
MPLVRTEANEAFALSPSNQRAQALLGLVAAVYDYDWDEADRLWIRIDYGVNSPTAVFLGIICLARRSLNRDLVELRASPPA